MPRRSRPPRPTPIGHFVDLITFRTIGVLLIANEVIPDSPADWHVLVAGFAMFFMPDALRGKSSAVWRVLEALADRDPAYDPTNREKDE